jgi:hypothetical protein
VHRTSTRVYKSLWWHTLGFLVLFVMATSNICAESEEDTTWLAPSETKILWRDTSRTDCLMIDSSRVDSSGIGYTDRFAFGLSATFAHKASSLSIMELYCIDYYRDSSVEYSFSPFAAASVTKINNQFRYSLRGAVDVLLLMVNDLTTRLLLGPTVLLLKSPMRYILYAPNSAINFRLYRGLKLTLATNTEYPLYRYHGSDRGVLFTPQIGFTLSGGKYGSDFGGIILTVGATEFWNFDGPDKDFGLAVRIGVMPPPGEH